FYMDFQIEIGLWIGIGAAIARSGQLLADAKPVAIPAGKGKIQIQLAAIGRAAEQARLEARALLIHPVDQNEIDGRLLAAPPCLRAHRLHGDEGGQHAIGAVEAAAKGLTIEMRADEDGGPAP